MTPRRLRVGVMHAPHGAAELRDIALASAAAVTPVIVFRERVAAANPHIVAMSRRLFETVIADENSLLPALSNVGLDGLTTFHDGELEYADEVITELGLPGEPSTPGVWDKLIQRKQLQRAGLTTVQVAQVDSPADLISATAEIGIPGVLKARRGNGGAGIAFIDDQTHLSQQLCERSQWASMLYESRIQGVTDPSEAAWLADYVSLDTVNTTIPHHIALLDKVLPSLARGAGADGSDSLIETGDLIPSRRPAPLLEEIQKYTSRCLTALGISWRITHTELKLTKQGPEIVEINGRTGGYVHTLLRLVGGTDLIRAAMLAACGSEPDLTAGLSSGYAMLLSIPFPRRSGVVRSLVSIDDLLALPSVNSVHQVASAGANRSDTNYLMATLTLYASCRADIDAAYATVKAAVNVLFTPDLIHDYS